MGMEGKTRGIGGSSKGCIGEQFGEQGVWEALSYRRAGKSGLCAIKVYECKMREHGMNTVRTSPQYLPVPPPVRRYLLT